MRCRLHSAFWSTILLLACFLPGCQVSDCEEVDIHKDDEVGVAVCAENSSQDEGIHDEGDERASKADRQKDKEVPDYSKGLPEDWESGRSAPVADSIQVWLLGDDYFHFSHGDHDDSFDMSCTSSFDDIEFTGIDLKTRSFLSVPSLKPAVQFSCATSPTPYEDALEKALRSDAWDLKLQALVLLMKVKSSRHVDLQWKVLKELQEATPSLRLDEFLSELEKRFELEGLMRELEALVKQGNRIGRFSQPEEKCWAIRAVAAIQHRNAIPLLAKLSTKDNLEISLAAERSLEDFEGEESDKALGVCLLGWKYNAFECAGYALLKRNKALLNQLLSSEDAPKNCRYIQGILLAECANPQAVPILCETVPRYQIIDGKMFAHIARLAGPEHRNMIELLPSRVRPNQLHKALAVERAYKDRMKELEGR
jgi:hypothetical protein